MSDAAQLVFIVGAGADGSDAHTKFSDALGALGDVSHGTPEAFATGTYPDVVVVHESSGPLEVLIQELKSRWNIVSVVAITHADANLSQVVQAGADLYISENASSEAIQLVVSRAIDISQRLKDAARLARRATETLSVMHSDNIIGSHPNMQQLLKRVGQVASTKATVLICGETGTGKELIAATIHQNSPRRDRPFVRLNCAALSDTILESELFGHEKGAFTGAVTRREGRFMQANGGTLFLDEVSEIPLRLQVKLLRFLQEREFERVGSNETVRVDVRIVAATNRDLKVLVEDGQFRDDLFYRLNVVRLDVPPLRARPSDVSMLADHFIRTYAEEHGRSVPELTDRAKRALLEYPWPGNVRELQNVIEQTVIFSDGKQVDFEDLPFAANPPEPDAIRLMIPGISLEELERYAILQTLEATGGSTSKAANILGISRRTIQYRLQNWGLGRVDDAGGMPSSDSSPPES